MRWILLCIVLVSFTVGAMTVAGRYDSLAFEAMRQGYYTGMSVLCSAVTVFFYAVVVPTVLIVLIYGISRIPIFRKKRKRTDEES